MGYVADTHMSKFISPLDFQFTAGTWTPTIGSNVVSMVRSQADASFTALIPIDVLSNASALKGARLKSIDVYYKIAVAADDFATVELEKMTLGVDDVAITGAAVAGACDAGHDTAAERKAADDDHVLTFSLTTPAWIDDGDAYILELIVDCAATTDFIFYGARANYDLRV
jgi:hypothetical protein